MYLFKYSGILFYCRRHFDCQGLIFIFIASFKKELKAFELISFYQMISLRDVEGPLDEETESPDYSGNDDDEIYCICRKSDTHKLMIQCNSCDEWYER
jgi:hypothetical protein